MPHKDRERRAAYSREYGKRWYQSHKQEVVERRKKRQKDIWNWFRTYKSGLSCMDCGISHPAVLQFHHRDRADKSFTISKVINRASSLKQITDEIAKCDVVCVNCHAKRHWSERHPTDSWLEIIS
jgi:hypothetical protein